MRDYKPAVRVRIFRFVQSEFSDAIRHDDKNFFKIMRGHILEEMRSVNIMAEHTGRRSRKG